MQISNTRTCEQCKSPTPFERLRLTAWQNERTRMVCLSCYGKAGKKESDVRIQRRPSSKISYHCARCNYSFRADPEKANITYRLLCPYCGNADMLQ